VGWTQVGSKGQNDDVAITVQLVVELWSRKRKRNLKNVQLVFQTQVVLILVVQITHTLDHKSINLSFVLQYI
jgi:hypothetical protein